MTYFSKQRGWRGHSVLACQQRIFSRPIFSDKNIKIGVPVLLTAVSNRHRASRISPTTRTQSTSTWCATSPGLKTQEVSNQLFSVLKTQEVSYQVLIYCPIFKPRWKLNSEALYLILDHFLDQGGNLTASSFSASACQQIHSELLESVNQIYQVVLLIIFQTCICTESDFSTLLLIFQAYVPK